MIYYKRIFCKVIAEYFEYCDELRNWFTNGEQHPEDIKKVQKTMREFGEAIYNRGGIAAMHIAHDLTYFDLKGFVAKSWNGIGIWRA